MSTKKEIRRARRQARISRLAQCIAYREQVQIMRIRRKGMRS